MDSTTPQGPWAPAGHEAWDAPLVRTLGGLRGGIVVIMVQRHHNHLNLKGSTGSGAENTTQINQSRLLSCESTCVHVWPTIHEPCHVLRLHALRVFYADVLLFFTKEHLQLDNKIKMTLFLYTSNNFVSTWLRTQVMRKNFTLPTVTLNFLGLLNFK